MNTPIAKTIRMPKPLLDKWLAALRSSSINGKPIKQARAMLCDRNGGYCCLGVLQVVASGRFMPADSELPRLLWLKRNGITFLDEAKGKSETPWIPSELEYVSNINDMGAPFAQIADYIEACAEGYEP